MEGKEQQENRRTTTSRGKMVGIAIIPLVVLGAMIVFLLGPGQTLLNRGTLLPDVSIERIEFHEENQILAYIRNTGPGTVVIAQADVNDRIVPAAIEPG